MKNFTLYFFILFINISLGAQTCPTGLPGTSISFSSEPGFDIIDTGVSQDVNGVCNRIYANGETFEGELTMGLNVNVSVGPDEVFCAIADGASITDLVGINPEFGCNTNLLNISGPINAYAVTADPINIINNSITASVSKIDVIQIFSPVDAEVELVVSAFVSLATIQTFCNPSTSVAEAEATVTATLGGTSASAGGFAAVYGGFLSNVTPANSSVLRVPVSAGVSNFNLTLSGNMMVRSKVLALNGILVCASNAVAIADGDGSIRISNFTGSNGSALPDGTTIIGLNSGIDYLNPNEPVPCSHIASPEIVVANDSCGLGLGSAAITNEIDSLNYVWSNGAIDNQTADLSYGAHFLNISDPSGCSRDFYFFIDDPEVPTITLPATVSFIENESVVLNPIDSVDISLSFVWSTGETTSTIEVDDEGVYSVQITTATGCTYLAETIVQAYSPIDLEPCLTANYLFSGNADDISGNNNHASVYGATLTEDRYNKTESAYYFDGIDDYIELPIDEDTQPETSMTFTAWFKTDNQSEANYTTIVNASEGYEVALNKTKSGSVNSNLELQSGDSFNLPSRYNYYNDYQWHSLAITYDGSDGVYRIYIDGNFNDEVIGNLDTIAYQSAAPFTIGANGITNSNFFKGSIDDIKIFDCVLNIDELNFLFTQQQNFDCHTLIYSEDFEATIGSEWSDTTRTIFETSLDTSKVLGNYSGEDTIALSLNGLPTDKFLTFCFDFWQIDSWDGNSGAFGPDYITVALNNNQTLVSTSFSHSPWEQSYPAEYDTENLRRNDEHTGAAFTGQVVNTSDNYIDSRYQLCRTFKNLNESLEVSVTSNSAQSLNDESWAIDNISVYVEPSILSVEDETVVCNPDGSYEVSLPFNSNGDNLNYMAYEQANTFEDIDTIFFTDDGNTPSIALSYPSNRDYNIVIAIAGDPSNCYPVTSGSVTCTFTEACNLTASINKECINDSLVITGTIIGGTSPYSIYSDEISTVLFPDDGNNFELILPNCNDTDIDFIVTDINMCQYDETFVAINELDSEDAIQLFPNPSNGYISISNFSKNENQSLEIYDSNGQLKHQLKNIEHNEMIGLKHLESGVYFIRLVSDSTNSKLKKLVLIK